MPVPSVEKEAVRERDTLTTGLNQRRGGGEGGEGEVFGFLLRRASLHGGREK